MIAGLNRDVGVDPRGRKAIRSAAKAGKLREDKFP